MTEDLSDEREERDLEDLWTGDGEYMKWRLGWAPLRFLRPMINSLAPRNVIVNGIFGKCFIFFISIFFNFIKRRRVLYF